MPLPPPARRVCHIAAGVLLAAGLALTVVCIWTGDLRWLKTSIVLLIACLILLAAGAPGSPSRPQAPTHREL